MHGTYDPPKSRGKKPLGKAHSPKTALEKGMVALAKKRDLKSIAATKRKGK